MGLAAKRVGLAFAALAVALCAAVALTGCFGPSKEELVKQAVADYLDPLTTNDDAAADYFWNELDGADRCEIYARDANDELAHKVALALTEDCTYKIDDMQIYDNPDTAFVNITMNCKAVYPAYFDVDGPYRISNDERTQQLIDGVEKANKKDYQLMLTLSTQDGKWQVNRDTADMLTASTFVGMDSETTDRMRNELGY